MAFSGEQSLAIADAAAEPTFSDRLRAVDALAGAPVARPTSRSV